MLHNNRNSAKMSMSHGGIGEVVNTPDCGSGMRGFDPHISPHIEIKFITVDVMNFFYDLFRFLISILLLSIIRLEFLFRLVTLSFQFQ